LGELNSLNHADATRNGIGPQLASATTTIAFELDCGLHTSWKTSQRATRFNTRTRLKSTRQARDPHHPGDLIDRSVA
jgi:hypothetical protein